MKLLSAVISLCCSFWMIIYLYGLKEVSSAKYNSIFQILPLVLIAIAIYCFYAYGREKEM